MTLNVLGAEVTPPSDWLPTLHHQLKTPSCVASRKSRRSLALGRALATELHKVEARLALGEQRRAPLPGPAREPDVHSDRAPEVGPEGTVVMKGSEGTDASDEEPTLPRKAR